jgi:hypothetical protein
MTVQSSSFLAVLSAAALLLVSANATSAASHKQGGTSFKQNGTPIVAGSTHRDPVLRNPPIVAGSTHNPVIVHPVHRKPPVCPGAGLPKCKPTLPPCKDGSPRTTSGKCVI